jgi:hypothetical protein
MPFILGGTPYTSKASLRSGLMAINFSALRAANVWTKGYVGLVSKRKTGQVLFVIEDGISHCRRVQSLPSRCKHSALGETQRSLDRITTNQRNDFMVAHHITVRACTRRCSGLLVFSSVGWRYRGYQPSTRLSAVYKAVGLPRTARSAHEVQLEHQTFSTPSQALWC